uniref:Protein lifeguard 4 n=1 Tax=Spermophilus dauricus TaxID=99837 RepID=A0A8C9PH64_SPEDA
MGDPDPRYPCSSIEDDFNYGSCGASATFLRKVYTILSLQVLLTTVTSTVFLSFESIRTFVHESPALILVFALGSLGLIFALTLNRHKHPLNLYLLFGFTLLEALTVAVVVTFYDVYIILQAFVLTTTVFLGLTIYTLQSKRDFSKFGAFCCFVDFMLGRILEGKFETVELVLAAVGALLFCGFIIYDTHTLMHKLSPEEYGFTYTRQVLHH